MLNFKRRLFICAWLFVVVLAVNIPASTINQAIAVFTSSLNGLAPASGGGTTNFLRADGSWAAPPGTGGTTSNQNIRTIGFHFDGNGSALAGTTVSCFRAPIAGTLNGWYIDSDVAGSATFGVRSVAFGSYTGTAGYAGYSDVTGGGTAPVLSAAVTATFANLTSWSTTVTAGTMYCAQLSSPATATYVNLYLTEAAN